MKVFKTKNILFLVLFLVAVFFSIYSAKLAFNGDDKIDLNNGWTVKVGNTVLENQDIFLKSVIDKSEFQNKFVWFSKRIIFPQEYKNKNISLSIGGIPFGHEVYFNGHLIGASPFKDFIFNDWNSRYSYYIPKEFIKDENVLELKLKSIYEYGANQSIFIAESSKVVKNNKFLNQYFISVYLALSIVNIIIAAYFIKLYSTNKMNKKYLYFAITLLFITLHYSNYYITSSVFGYLWFQKVVFLSFYCAALFFVMFLRKNYGYKFNKRFHFISQICGMIIFTTLVIPRNLITFACFRKKLYLFFIIAILYIIYMIIDVVFIKKLKNKFTLLIYSAAFITIIHDILIDLSLISKVKGIHLNSYAIMLILMYGAYDMAKEYNSIYLNSIIDSLTGLYNRRYFDSYILNLGKSDEDYCLFIIDFDGFKSINDNFGHAVGDIVLKSFGQIVNNILYKGCFAARIGGEEFAILCEKQRFEGQKLAEEIRYRIENYDWGNKTTNKNLKVTVSIGAVCFKGKDIFNKVFKAADEALYLAKDSGKNKVVWGDLK
ncbi:diguanylate cyclase (GGDEF) domain-containing protein [Caloramator quimbayensis]|uniref:Diguanylate cyclase (GGDEF) domain-containing protein n=1 Tax=Caloramator quimbayensis TaxID=1147123 RepID=A0A1T4YGP9_9CLOT|nr:GGDEF domain-containing protein [Caloramator quimbayensis]SKB00949.1 diguanylate cyclase (GGDEF) domain-containing protein [Caloramator quimbayensis]